MKESLEKNSAKEWKNTYQEQDFFKVLVIGSNKEHALATSQWLAGLNTTYRGVYRTEHKAKKIVFYFTWPRDEEDHHQNTIGIDAICAASDSDNDFNDIKNELVNFPGISVRLLISKSTNGSSEAQQINGEFLLRTDINSKEVIEKLDQMDMNEYVRLTNLFNKYDENKSGAINIKEISNIAKDSGIDLNSKTFQDSVLALDTNHDQQINLNEFLQWYKIGRTHVLPISKIYQLHQYVQSLIEKMIDFKAFKSDLTNQGIANKRNTNSIKILLESERLEELVTRLHLNLTLGGPKRLDVAKNFLSKFTSTHSYTDSSWINIAVFTKSLTISGTQLLVHMQKFQTKLIEWAEKSGIEGLSGFIGKFIEFRSYSNESAANIYMKLKLDIEGLMKSALEEVLLIRDWLSDEKNSFDFNLRVYSSACLGELVKDNKSIADFLNVGELELDAHLLKTRLRTLLANLKPEYSSILGLFQLFFMSTNLNLKFKGPFNEFSNEGSFSFFNKGLSFMEPIINFVKSNFDSEVLKCFSRMEFTFNLFEMFANLQIFSDSIWA